MKKINLVIILFLIGGFRLAFGQVTFNYTGGMQSYTVPPGSSAICFTVSGAQGNGNTFGNMGGGLGGRIIGTMPVTPGQVLQFFVGGGGNNNTQLGGFNGGGNGGIVTSNCCTTNRGGGGGGASDIRIAPFGLADRVVVAGGGGGTGGQRIQGCAPGCGGGAGGGWYGGGGGGAYGGSPGAGGTQVGGGAGGAACCGCPLSPQPGAAGAFGVGGQGGDLLAGCNNQAANNPGCVGGVGGAAIGGQGPNCTGGTGCPSTWAGASGGGGSNYVLGGYTLTSNFAGVQAGNGQIIINPGCCATPSITIASNPTAICVGGTATLTGGGAGVGGTYTWQPGGQTTSVIAVTPTATTIYTLMGTTASSCTGSQTFQLIVNPLPVVNPGSNSPICQGVNLNLTVGAFNSYTWTGPNAFTSNLQNPVIPNAQPNASGVYTVAVTNANGCVNSGTVSVTVNAGPVVNPTNGGPYCPGATITLSITAFTSYTWTGPVGFTSNNQFPTITNAQITNGGIYTVSATGGGGCASTGTTNVIVNAPPTPTATSNSPVCVNKPINLSGFGAVTYSWSGPGGFIAIQQFPVIASAQPSNAGVYTLSVTAATGCTAVTTTTVIVNALPPVTTTNQTVCYNTTINLFSGGANSYVWSGPNGFNSNIQNPSIPNATNLNSGNYTVIGTSAAGCTAAAVALVNVLPLPAPTIQSNDPVCVGGTLNLNGTAGGSYSWTGPNGFISNTVNPSIANVNMAANGVYTLIVTVGSCTGSITKSVIINPLPTPTLSSNSPVCLLQTINLTGSGGNTYTWAGPNGFSGSGNVSIPSANNTNIGTYTATATDINGCSNTATIAVSINPFPIISAVGSTICAGKTLSLSAAGGTTYTWAGPLNFSSQTQSPTIDDANTAMAGTYSVTVTDLNGCTSTSVTNVKVNTLPTVTASANSPICANDTINLTSGASTNNHFLWTGPNGFVSLLKNPVILDAQIYATGIYTVEVTDEIGCSAKATVAMVVSKAPDVAITASKFSGCVPLCVNFNSQSSTSLSTGFWKFGDGSTSTGLTADKCYNLAGNYQIKSKFTDIYGCFNEATTNVEVYPFPIADFNFGPSKPIINDAVEFSDASSNANVTGWTWNFSHMKGKVILSETVKMSFESPGAYVAALIVTSDHGCKDTIVKPIIVGDDFGIYVPDAFSPNTDGINDVFQPKGFGITKFEMQIFDRWGEKLFSTTDMNEGWNGAFVRRGDKVVEEGVYIWRINLTNVFGKQKELTGKVTVLK